MYDSKLSRRRQKSVISSASTESQWSTEEECSHFFVPILQMPLTQRQDLTSIGLISSPDDDRILLLKEKHAAYLSKPLNSSAQNILPKSYLSLDSSRPWIIYWNLHSLDLLDLLPSVESLQGIISTLKACWMDVSVRTIETTQDKESAKPQMCQGGGFGGGPGQLPHCAPTYAAVNALLIIGGLKDEEYSTVKSLAIEFLMEKRILILNWFLSLRYEYDHNQIDMKNSPPLSDVSNPCGYRMHHDGEVDVRASYCICSVASLLNIMSDELTKGMINHIVLCQTYEGGFGGEPFCEAHGGYTFCALGALHLLKKALGISKSEESGVDVDALGDWLVKRQMSYEGGFQGRCNKFVDGCYSFWVGGAIAVLQMEDVSTSIFGQNDNLCDDSDNERVEKACEILIRDENEEGYLLFDQKLLNQYILLCAQDVNGGLRDKPSKPRDFYHSCYNLSGLSVAQHSLSQTSFSPDSSFIMRKKENVNILGATHPIFNIRVERVQEAIRKFYEK